jgi:hypothetical protein
VITAVVRRYHVNNILHYPLLVSAYCIFFSTKKLYLLFSTTVEVRLRINFQGHLGRKWGGELVSMLFRLPKSHTDLREITGGPLR